MSLLPQRKKSAEEIAQLRESLGIGGPTPDATESPAAETAPAPEVQYSPPEPAIPQETPPALAPPGKEPAKPVHSLKRSERVPVLPVQESGPPPHAVHPPEPAPDPLPAPAPAVATHAPRTVKSLRKSEQGPLPPLQPPAPDSPLPYHRHCDAELNEIRRREALSLLAPAAHPQSLVAHRVLIVPGYLFAIAGAVSFLVYDAEIAITAACVAVAVMIAGFIFHKKPLSRHHAAFIGVISLFVIVFGALHYFPQLRHGT